MRKVLCGLATAFTGLLGASWTWATSVPAQLPNTPPVVLGGTNEMTDLLTASNTSDFRAMGGGVYLNYSSWSYNSSDPTDSLTATQRQQIWDLFQPDGNADAELGYDYPPTGWQDGVETYYESGDIPVYVACVNNLNDASLSDAQAYISAIKSVGVANVAEVATPNSGDEAETDPFIDPSTGQVNAYYATTCQIAQAGGGWAIDAPPNYFFSMPAGYRTWIVQETQWTNSQGSVSVDIISPNNDGANFFTDSVDFVQYLEQNNAIPKQWVIENYDYAPGQAPAGYINNIGSEDTANTCANVADWLINHVQGRPNSLDLYASHTINGSVYTVGQNTFNTNPASQNNPLKSTGEQTYTINLSNLGTDTATDFYSPVLLGTTSGDAAHWDIQILFDNQDITSSVLDGGFTFDGNNMLQAGQDDLLTLNLTPLAGAGSYFDLDLYSMANPDATVYTDAISFSVPEPGSLGICAALVGIGMLKRRRR